MNLPTFLNCAYGEVFTKATSRKEIGKAREMALAFVDLEKGFDTVPRNMAMATLRWMEASESEVKMVEAMYENIKGRVVVGSSMSNEFQVNIGLRRGNALSPLVFILVMELISRNISTTLCSGEEYVLKRSCDRCTASGWIARRTGGMEWDV